MTSRLLRTVAAPLVLLSPACVGCTSQQAPAATAASTSATSAAVPTSAAGLEALLVDQVPSGLPLVPDDELDPPAGEKTIDDVARYGEDDAGPAAGASWVVQPVHHGVSSSSGAATVRSSREVTRRPARHRTPAGRPAPGS